MEKIQRENAEIKDYCISQDVLFSPALLFDPIEQQKREIPDRPIEFLDEPVDINEVELEAINNPNELMETSNKESEPTMESTENSLKENGQSISNEQFLSLLQAIHEQLIDLASPILSQLQTDSLLPSSLSVSSLSPERIAY